MTTQWQDVRYENVTEPNYLETMRGVRRRRLAVSSLLVLLSIVPIAFVPVLLQSGNMPLVWLAIAVSLFYLVLLVMGLSARRTKPIEIKVTSEGIQVPRRGWIPASELERAFLFEAKSFLFARRSPTDRKFLFVIDKRDVANVPKLREAIESVTIGGGPESGKEELA